MYIHYIKLLNKLLLVMHSINTSTANFRKWTCPSSSLDLSIFNFKDKRLVSLYEKAVWLGPLLVAYRVWFYQSKGSQWSIVAFVTAVVLVRGWSFVQFKLFTWISLSPSNSLKEGDKNNCLIWTVFSTVWLKPKVMNIGQR